MLWPLKMVLLGDACSLPPSLSPSYVLKAELSDQNNFQYSYEAIAEYTPPAVKNVHGTYLAAGSWGHDVDVQMYVLSGSI